MHKARAFFLICGGLLLPALLLPRLVIAAWPVDPNVNAPICTADSVQQSVTSISDGVGGAIVTWEDHRGGDWDIYAQRISATGTPLWTANGVAICAAIGTQGAPAIASDGGGGAFVTWQDRRSGVGYGDIYAQRISVAGTVQWNADGVPLCTATSAEVGQPLIVSDGAGGAIVTWVDQRSGNRDIYVQRISATGTSLWTERGVNLCPADGHQYSPAIVSDGAGGAIVIWKDGRCGFPDYCYLAQRISATGTAQWTPDGVAFLSAGGECPIHAWFASDGAGGVIAARDECGSLSVWRLRSDAVTAWGAEIGPRSSWTDPAIVSDGSGGAIVAWRGRGSDDEYGVRTKRISATGTPQWAAYGVALCTARGEQYNPAIVSDDAGGATVSWQDGRSGNSDIYMQKISAAGTPQWATDGVALSTAMGSQQYPIAVSDGAGGAIVVWTDARNGGPDIYAQRVLANGQLGGGNRPPDCSGARPSVAQLWPANHEMVPVGIIDVTDPDGDPVMITYDRVSQDEPLEAMGRARCQDAQIVNGQLELRAERDGRGNGRVYEIAFTASDGHGGACQGTVSVCVSHDRRADDACVDDGQHYNSMQICKPVTSRRSGQEEDAQWAPTSLQLTLSGMTGDGALFEYALPDEVDVLLAVYDIAGRRVATLEKERQSAGLHQTVWNASGVSRGVYFCRLQTGRGSVTRSVPVLNR